MKKSKKILIFLCIDTLKISTTGRKEGKQGKKSAYRRKKAGKKALLSVSGRENSWQSVQPESSGHTLKNSCHNGKQMTRQEGKQKSGKDDQSGSIQEGKTSRISSGLCKTGTNRKSGEKIGLYRKKPGTHQARQESRKETQADDYSSGYKKNHPAFIPG